MRRIEKARLRVAPALTALLLLASLLGTGAAVAQLRLPGAKAEKTETTEAPATPQPELLAKEREELAPAIESLRASIAGGDAGSATLERLALLERLDRTLAAHQEALGHLQALQAADLGATDGSLIGADPPFPFALYEATSQALDMHRKQVGLLEERAKVRREEVERLAARHEKVERERRRAKERVETSTDPLQTARRTEALRRLEAESRLAQAELARTRTQAQLETREAEAQRGQVELLEATLRHVRSRVAITRYDLDEPLNRITLAEERARGQIEKARPQLETAERRLTDVQQRTDRLATIPAELRAELEARRLQRQVAQARITTAEARLEQLALERMVWERRIDALGSAARDELAIWSDEIQREIDRLRRTERLQATQGDELAQATQRLRETLETAEGPAAPWLREQLQAAEALEAIRVTAVSDAAAMGAFLNRTLRDFLPATGPLDPMAELRSFLSRARETWDREVFVVDDRSITLGKIVLASVLFVLAFSLSRFIATVLGRFLYRRVLDSGAALAFQSLTFYGLLVAFFLVALRTVNIPLTAFALLGGALAIGLGFGSQNIIGNFISGLILLVERPIKVGDVVDVDGVAGVIDRVGPRSTQIRTFDNLHIIVPNSMLLEQKVVNWTLSDDTIRRQINLGVSYDAPVRDVARLIMRALDEHGLVLRKPEPKVFFQDFGDNALVFRIYFWMRLNGRAGFMEVESDLRHRILHLFRDAGITIAFPQRDVHFDSAQPLEVRVLPTVAADGEGS